jgi:hypothetical protein
LQSLVLGGRLLRLRVKVRSFRLGSAEFCLERLNFRRRLAEVRRLAGQKKKKKKKRNRKGWHVQVKKFGNTTKHDKT